MTTLADATTRGRTTLHLQLSCKQYAYWEQQSCAPEAESWVVNQEISRLGFVESAQPLSKMGRVGR